MVLKPGNIPYQCTGVILAGGLSKRFSGKNKALIRIGCSTILDRIYEVFKELFQEIILVTNDPARYLKWDFTIVTDIYPARSSLTGIYSGLFFATNPYVFFSPCDTPFLKKELVEMIIESIEPGIDVVVPETSNGMEPLCAVYSQQCFHPVKGNMLAGRFMIQKLFKKLRVKKIPETKIREKDADLISFININTAHDLARANELVHPAVPNI